MQSKVLRLEVSLSTVVTKMVPGLSGGVSLSVAVCLAILAIPLIYKYSNKKNKKGNGSGDPDILELPEVNA